MPYQTLQPVLICYALAYYRHLFITITVNTKERHLQPLLSLKGLNMAACNQRYWLQCFQTSKAPMIAII